MDLSLYHQMASAVAPWFSPDAGPPEYLSNVHREGEPQEEIDRCLNCKNPDCLYSDWRGDCPDMSEHLFLADFFSLQESE